jgi:hypothetical protein
MYVYVYKNEPKVEDMKQAEVQRAAPFQTGILSRRLQTTESDLLLAIGTTGKTKCSSYGRSRPE